jgi:hypothetical protein
MYSGGHSRQPSTSQFQLDSENETAVEEEETSLFSFLIFLWMKTLCCRVFLVFQLVLGRRFFAEETEVGARGRSTIELMEV